MKKLPLVLLLCLLAIPTPALAQASEEEAIRAVIEAETRAFFNRDHAEWTRHFVHHDAAFQAWSNEDGTYDASVGWEEVNRRIRSYIDANPAPSHPLVIRKNFKYRIHGEVAYVNFDQYNSSSDGTRMTPSKELRVMEKENGQWKIAAVAAFWDYSYPYTVQQVQAMR